jgi:hypothetical protein
MALVPKRERDGNGRNGAVAIDGEDEPAFAIRAQGCRDRVNDVLGTSPTALSKAA